MIGTHELKEKNEIHVIEYDEDDPRGSEDASVDPIRCVGVYAHAPGAVWQLDTSSSDPDLLATAYIGESGDWRCSVWRLAEMKATPGDSTAPSDEGQVAAATPEAPSPAPLQRSLSHSTTSSQLDGGSLSPLKHETELAGHGGPITSVRWSAGDDGEDGKRATEDTIVTLDGKRLRVWRLGAATDAKSTRCLESPVTPGISAGCFDPHSNNGFVTAVGQDVVAWDLRTLKPAISVKRAHSSALRDVDYNPNRPSHIVTAGEDMLVRFWDLRKPQQALKVLGGHTHWVSRARYNSYHDQLLLSAGTDGVVNLWSIVSASSAPVGAFDSTSGSRDDDKRIQKYEEHRDSVYSIAWSSDAWVFASLSLDGTVAINTVPQNEKYKILL